ncbi:MAG: hypothetical protein SGCHY_002632 [Lobulomycetales sp.]
MFVEKVLVPLAELLLATRVGSTAEDSVEEMLVGIMLELEEDVVSAGISLLLEVVDEVISLAVVEVSLAVDDDVLLEVDVLVSSEVDKEVLEVVELDSSVVDEVVLVVEEVLVGVERPPAQERFCITMPSQTHIPQIPGLANGSSIPTNMKGSCEQTASPT